MHQLGPMHPQQPDVQAALSPHLCGISALALRGRIDYHLEAFVYERQAGEIPPACRPVNPSASRSVGRTTFFLTQCACQQLQIHPVWTRNDRQDGFLPFGRVMTDVL